MNCGEKSLGRKRRRSRKWRKKTWVEGVDVELRFGKHDEEAREAFWKGMVSTLEMVPLHRSRRASYPIKSSS